jgi:hypothetical protein
MGAPTEENAMTPNPLIETAADDRHKGTCCANNYCRVCGAHVSGYNCNEALTKERPGDEFDYWAVCDNAECIHAIGEGFYMQPPDWVERRGP